SNKFCMMFSNMIKKPPNPNLNIGPVGGGQSLHSQTNMNDSMGTGLPPTSLMQSQMSNGPSHVLTQQQPSTSMSHGTGPGYSHSAPTSQGQVAYSSMASRANLNMQSSQVSMMHQQGTGSHYSSTSAGGQHYQGQQTGIMAQGNQGNSIMSQRPMGSYCVPQQGSAPQYMGQEEFYGEQYGHTQSSSEPVSQQYYSDGHEEYSYQQSSYGEQNYERSFDESSQHYYEGGEFQLSMFRTKLKNQPSCSGPSSKIKFYYNIGLLTHTHTHTLVYVVYGDSP
uniref:SS18L1 subunit of BAF chromatin remodeling complex n=1 Tax=Sinocyclocheilus rhinocerous TaxID=307959 RepID=A0A673KN64_9TELE